VLSFPRKRESKEVTTVASVCIVDAEQKIRYQDLPLRVVEEALETLLTEKGST
jgi:hypothetical protein